MPIIERATRRASSHHVRTNSVIARDINSTASKLLAKAASNSESTMPVVFHELREFAMRLRLLRCSSLSVLKNLPMALALH